jgi:tetratricopeptide (TPR) repeat protein
MRLLQIHLFGSFELQKQNQRLTELPTQKMKSLFAYLVTQRRSSHPREVLAELFWGDWGADKARSNLRYSLSVLRRHLGEYLLIERHQVGFNTKSDYWLDVQEFEKLVLQGQDLHAEERFQTLRQALDLYRGDFLMGFYDEWVLAEQERLRELYREVLETLALWPEGPFLGQPTLRKSEEAGLKRELARAHLSLADPEGALLFAEQALKLYEQTQDLHGQGEMHLLTGTIHRYLGQNQRAADYYQKALALGRQTGNLRIEWRTLNNLGWLEWNLKHPRKAQDCYEQALAVCLRIGERWGASVVLNNHGIALLDQGKYTQALECFDQAYETIAAVEDKELELENLSYRVLAHLRLQALDKVRQYVGEILTRLEAESGGTSHLSFKVHLNLWRVLHATGRTNEACQHLQWAYEDVMKRAQMIKRPSLRRSFLAQVRTNREIREAWASQSQ